MTIYFSTINPVNYVLARVLALFFKIVYWQPENVPESWLRHFENIGAEDLMNLDQWYSTSEEIHSHWTNTIATWEQRPPLMSRACGVEIDFTDTWFQWLARAYERHYFFLKLSQMRVAREGGSAYRVSTLLDARQENLILRFPENSLKVLYFLSFADRLWLWIKAFRPLAKIFIQTFSISSKIKPLEQKKYGAFWVGISTPEMADGPSRLDFSAISRQAGASKSEIYFLPNTPSGSCRAWLKENNLTWAPFTQSFLLIPFYERLKTLLSILGASLRLIFSLPLSFNAPCVLSFLYQGAPWIPLLHRFKPQVFLSSISASWPDLPAVAAANAVGVRTVLWFYGSNIFRYNSSSERLAELDIAHSVPVSKEIWVWSREAEIEYSRRHVRLPEFRPIFRIIGPVMCGNAGFLETSASLLRKNEGILEKPGDFFISVFDVPAITKISRARWGFGPAPYPIEMLDKFFADLIYLLEEFPQVKLILKPKRTANDPTREYPPNMAKLWNPDESYVKNARVIALDHTADPYQAVAMADLCLGLPFTSPVLVALNKRRLGLYHDPLNTIWRFRPQALSLVMTHGRDELRMRVAEMLENRWEIPFHEFESVVGPVGDPLSRFNNLINNPQLSI